MSHCPPWAPGGPAGVGGWKESETSSQGGDVCHRYPLVWGALQDMVFPEKSMAFPERLG
jgi:hypothetical protein